jgi:hypothetical protein
MMRKWYTFRRKCASVEGVCPKSAKKREREGGREGGREEGRK